ncbi:MAG TPA: peptide-methionine (R)-S-oxide reductase MsrB [Rhizomicrobium sp.]|nr:peptide-methionine (R)-S-oxide reductase MsrB [Rhizomicrobium sp.]
MRRRNFIGFLLMASAGIFAGNLPAFAAAYRVSKSDAEWKKTLSPAAYDVLRHQGTEMPYSSPLDMNTKKGTYLCAGCGQPLYSSDTKYDSHTGWPSFWKPLTNAILTSDDHSLDMERTEVHCIGCGGHLGHVFDDGPKPTGLRYCMNGVALRFEAI